MHIAAFSLAGGKHSLYNSLFYFIFRAIIHNDWNTCAYDNNIIFSKSSIDILPQEYSNLINISFMEETSFRFNLLHYHAILFTTGGGRAKNQDRTLPCIPQ
jgi:hypothetical protein